MALRKCRYCSPLTSVMSRILFLTLMVAVAVVPSAESFIVATPGSRSTRARFFHSYDVAGTIATMRRVARARIGEQNANLGKLPRCAGVGDGSAEPSTHESRGATNTCRNCRKQYRWQENADNACSYHPGIFSGRLNRINDVDTSDLEYFWSCCGEADREHPGCVVGPHASYDDRPEGEQGGWRSPLTGTWRAG